MNPNSCEENLRATRDAVGSAGSREALSGCCPHNLFLCHNLFLFASTAAPIFCAYVLLSSLETCDPNVYAR